MKAVLTLLLLVVIVQSLPHSGVFEKDWNAFKLEYDKSYENANEEQLRRQIFEDNMVIMAKHNERYEAGEETYTMGVNQFSDLLTEEFQTLFLGHLNTTDENDELEEEVSFDPLEDVQLPSHVDWRQKGAVTRVKQQGNCLSCWAFAAVGALEGQHFLKSGKLVELSVQNLVDCSRGRPYNNIGCQGGLASPALEYVHHNKGIDTESSYPYRAHQDQCRFNRRNVGATVKKVMHIKKGSEYALARAVAEIGPIAVSIEATPLQHYKYGVLRKRCYKRADHAVLVVGYGHDSRGGDYWLVKNSWGIHTGENGYVRMARNARNMCFIANRGVYPVV